MEICCDQLKVLQSAPFPHMRLPSFTFSSPDLCTNPHHPLLLLGMAPNSWLPVGQSQATLHTLSCFTLNVLLAYPARKVAEQVLIGLIKSAFTR